MQSLAKVSNLGSFLVVLYWVIISAIFYLMFLVIVSIGTSEIRSMGADVGACFFNI